MMDLGLQERTTDLKLGEPRNKIWWVVMWSALQTQDRKNQVSKLILGKFLNLFMILQILTSVKEITLVT